MTDDAELIFSEGGLKLPAALAGNPLTFKFTTPVKPPEGVTVMS